MKTWYKAVCDEHKEMVNIFVNNVATTYHYLHGPQGETKHLNDFINTWLQTHYGCKLRLIHHDDDLDFCFNKGYKVMEPRKYKI